MNKNFVASELLAVAKDLTAADKARLAILSDGRDDPYSESERDQLTNRQIPKKKNAVMFSTDKAVRHLASCQKDLEEAQEELADLVWLRGTTGDKNTRRSEIMLKSLEKHIKTVEELQAFIQRIGKWA